MKKILIYNWIPFDEKEGKGGGVTVYTRNLIHHLVNNTEWQVYFLSSGRAYDPFKREAFIEQTENLYGERCKSFQIVNSPVLSSANVSFPFPWKIQEDKQLKKVVRHFFEREGAFDVVHFQNLEGLSLSVLELKDEFKQTTFIYSLHNYYPFCPQVMLWRKKESACRQVDCGRCCVDCMPQDVYRHKVIFNQSMNYYRIKRKNMDFGKRFQKMVETCYKGYHKYRGGRSSDKRVKKLSEYFSQYRSLNVQYLNQYMDHILAVSGRVKELAVSFGVEEQKLGISYIGTEAAKNQKGFQAYPFKEYPFRLCYLGYMRKEKGFYFLLDAMEEMADVLAERISITFAARITDLKAQERLERLQNKFAEITLYDGYSHEEFPEILSGVQLGIVPPLWEDNLPQVAIELKAFGIPVLSSNLGGAQELTSSEEFVFEAGNKENFLMKLKKLVEEPDRLNLYWEDAKRLVTMQEHMSELLRYYG